MHLTSILSLAVAAVSCAAGQTEFHMGMGMGMGGVLLPRQQSRLSLQTFTGALGGARAAAITKSDDPERPFEVDGDTFVGGYFTSSVSHTSLSLSLLLLEGRELGKGIILANLSVCCDVSERL